ncbi:MAG: hypothetical protein M1820_010071 [Bogoriella megaspora]|nr:MAG: hypothetical protein M1820_010071 [Bogoriella megaspora]
MFTTGLANLALIGPATTKVMIQRKHQETRDGKRSFDPGPHSSAMEKLNKDFGILHGASTIVNLVGLGAMIWYGTTIARKM